MATPSEMSRINRQVALDREAMRRAKNGTPEPTPYDRELRRLRNQRYRISLASRSRSPKAA